MARLVTDFLNNSVEALPDKIFAEDKYSEITYRKLREKSLVISCYINSLGYDHMPVAIYMSKSIQCIVSMMGIAYSGCFYSVLDTKSSATRNQMIIDDLEPAIIITEHQYIDNVSRYKGLFRIVVYDDIFSMPVLKDNIVEKRDILGTDLFCIIYTSGSTGCPKGVAIPHRAVVNYIEDASTDYQNISSQDIFGNQYPFYYVASLDDIYLTIRNGASIYILPEELFFSPSKLVDRLIEKKINVINWVPSALELVADYNALDGKNNIWIKKVIFGGEAINTRVLNYWMKALPDATFINGYGATETTEGTTYCIIDHVYDESEKVPLGIPLKGVELLVMDEDGNTVGEGQQGELYVRTDYLSYGYYKDFAKTQEVFVQNPLNNKFKEIVYKTGDIVEIDCNGNIFFVGRRDSQIKKNGHRINLSEIEETIKKIASVKECVCFYNSEEKLIEAIYTGSIGESELQKQLLDILSPTMRPNSIKRIDKMPLNSNGKIDKVLLTRGKKR